MATVTNDLLVQQLHDRRLRLEAALEKTPAANDLGRLLAEVDAALARVADGSFGICEICHDPIEPERLLVNPLLRFCLGDLSDEEQRALEQDLQTAARIQKGLLPESDLTHSGWQVHFRYQPAGPVSGDYCDVVCHASGDLFFMFGDVSGKGVAAAILMSHLHATFRTLVAADVSVAQLVERANRIFRESTLSTYFATLVCGRASTGGEVEICNAGHWPPLVVREGSVVPVETTGLPVGTFYSTSYTSRRVKLAKGEAIVLYTDGLTEARDRSDREYGSERLAHVLKSTSAMVPRSVVDTCLEDLAVHLGGAPMRDDLTMMVVRRAA
jgi:phosphoserine phosphatase RsbU/P